MLALRALLRLCCTRCCRPRCLLGSGSGAGIRRRCRHCWRWRCGCCWGGPGVAPEQVGGCREDRAEGDGHIRLVAHLHHTCPGTGEGPQHEGGEGKTRVVSMQGNNGRQEGRRAGRQVGRASRAFGTENVYSCTRVQSARHDVVALTLLNVEAGLRLVATRRSAQPLSRLQMPEGQHKSSQHEARLAHLSQPSCILNETLVDLSPALQVTVGVPHMQPPER